MTLTPAYRQAGYPLPGGEGILAVARSIGRLQIMAGGSYDPSRDQAFIAGRQ
jgi:hypothetical protein